MLDCGDMHIYIAVALQPTQAKLEEAVLAHVPASDRHKLQADRGWLIKYEGTTIELCNALGITGQPKGEPSPIGSTLVAPIGAYYGRGPTDMWEWLKTRFEQ